MNQFSKIINELRKNPLYLSLSLHGTVLIILVISSWFGASQIIKAVGDGEQSKPIIQAGLIDNNAVKTAVARQEQQERAKKKQLAQQKENVEKIKKEAESVKLEAQKLQKEVAVAKRQAEQEKQLAIAAKIEAENAKLQAVTEQKKVQLAKEQAAKKLEQVKQANQQAAKEKAQAQAQQAKEQELARANAEREKQAKAEIAAAAAAAQAQAMASQQQAARNSWLDSEFTRVVGELQQRVYNHRTLSSAFGADLKCEIQVKLLPEGSVHDVRIVKSSGNIAYDSMAEAAVYKAAPFDMPTDPELVAKLRDIVLEFTNESEG